MPITVTFANIMFPTKQFKVEYQHLLNTFTYEVTEQIGNVAKQSLSMNDKEYKNFRNKLLQNGWYQLSTQSKKSI